MNNFKIKIGLWNEPDYKTGTTIAQFNFMPTIGMHFGGSQLLTVCQIHFMGVSKIGFDFEIHLKSQNNHSTDEIEAAFPGDYPWKWVIEDEEDKAEAPETEFVSKSVERRTAIQTDQTVIATRRTAEGLEKTMQCNCDLDNWEPEKSTGHSFVCCIHKATIEKHNRQNPHRRR